MKRGWSPLVALVSHKVCSIILFQGIIQEPFALVSASCSYSFLSHILIDAYEYRDFVLFLRIKDFIFYSFICLLLRFSLLLFELICNQGIFLLLLYYGFFTIKSPDGSHINSAGYSPSPAFLYLFHQHKLLSYLLSILRCQPLRSIS